MFKYLELHIFTEPPTLWKYNKELSKCFIVFTICQHFKKIILRPIILFTLTQYSIFPQELLVLFKTELSHWHFLQKKICVINKWRLFQKTSKSLSKPKELIFNFNTCFYCIIKLGMFLFCSVLSGSFAMDSSRAWMSCYLSWVQNLMSFQLNSSSMAQNVQSRRTEVSGPLRRGIYRNRDQDTTTEGTSALYNFFNGQNYKLECNTNC